ncbi:hypothetical protein BC831DRAFT_463964, partial [Entophlyctis helioformis]
MVLEHDAGHDIPRDGEFVNAFAAAIRTMMGLSADQPMATSVLPAKYNNIQPANAATVTEPHDTKPAAKSLWPRSSVCSARPSHLSWH